MIYGTIYMVVPFFMFLSGYGINYSRFTVCRVIGFTIFAYQNLLDERAICIPSPEKILD